MNLFVITLILGIITLISGINKYLLSYAWEVRMIKDRAIGCFLLSGIVFILLAFKKTYFPYIELIYLAILVNIIFQFKANKYIYTYYWGKNGKYKVDSKYLP